MIQFQLVMKFVEPGLKVGTRSVKGEEVLTGEDGAFTYIRSLGPKPLSQSGQPKSRPVVEDFRVLTSHVTYVHLSEVPE